MRGTESLPCIACGKILFREWSDSRFPGEGTEFQTYGHYGSTFWDDMGDGEQIIINICDDCLRANTDKIMRQKRFRSIHIENFDIGREWLNHEPVAWFEGDRENDAYEIAPNEIDLWNSRPTVELDRDRVKQAREMWKEEI